MERPRRVRWLWVLAALAAFAAVAFAACDGDDGDGGGGVSGQRIEGGELTLATVEPDDQTQSHSSASTPSLPALSRRNLAANSRSTILSAISPR